MKLNWRAILKNLKNPSSPLQTAVLVIVAAAVYAYRAHPYLTNPQLFAEDGNVWLAEGHNKNIFALLQPVNGFLHFPERLFGFVVAHLSLQLAPLIFVLTAWGLFILLVYYLLSSRTKILKNNFERLFMVACLALIANIEILFFNFSNSTFLMGIIGALILVATRPKNVVLAVAEKAFFFLSCFTLPFSWFFLPIALVERFKYKRKDLFFLLTSLLGSIVEAIYYIASHVDRSSITLLSLFSKWTLLELYNQMIIPAVRFARIDTPVLDYDSHHYPVYMVSLTVIALLIAAFVVLKKANRQVRYLLFFLAAMTFASVKSPTLSIKLPVDALKAMAVVTGAARYFVYGIVAVNLIFVKAAYTALAPRARYLFVGLFLSFGLITSLHYYTFYVNKNFTDYSAQYRQGIDLFESGHANSLNIPVNPYPWKMTLSH